MPFDGVKFQHRPQPRRPSLKANFLCGAFVAAAFVMMVMPVSLDGLIDIVRYLHLH